MTMTYTVTPGRKLKKVALNGQVFHAVSHRQWGEGVPRKGQSMASLILLISLEHNSLRVGRSVLTKKSEP